MALHSHALDIAEQLTIIDLEIFQRIEVRYVLPSFFHLKLNLVLQRITGTEMEQVFNANFLTQHSSIDWKNQSNWILGCNFDTPARGMQQCTVTNSGLLITYPALIGAGGCP